MASLFSNKNNGSDSDQEYCHSDKLFDDRDMLHVLIDNMPDFIYIKDRSSIFILANKVVANSHGLKSGNLMIGKSDHDYYPKELANKYYQNEQDIIRSGEPMIGIEEKSLNDKGEEIYLSTTKIPFKDKNGKILGIVGIGRDITARKKAEAQAIEHTRKLEYINSLLEEKTEEIQQQAEELTAQTEHLRTANLELEKLSVAVRETDNVVIILDADGNFEWVNKSFTRVYGQTMDKYISEHGNNIKKVSNNPDIDKIFDQCRESRETIRYHAEASNKEGNKIWTQSTLTPVFDTDNNLLRFVAIDTDITALKMAQKMISDQKTELEIRGRELEKANLTKDKFFSIIAHDLKNPFHTILGFSDLIAKNFDDIPDEKKREYVGLIHDSSQSANTLLDNLLNWSRTQTNRIKFSPIKIELFSTVLEVERMLHSTIKNKEINFKNQIPEKTYAWADPNMMQTILRNLISNAIKFTPAKGTIKLTAESRDERILISVADSGIGISEEKQNKIFDFGEFDSTSGTEGERGTGLGLLICHEFVKKHDGNLAVKSKIDAGATFTFDIPASEPNK